MAAEDLERTIDELNAAMQALVAAISPAAAATLEKTKADRDAINEQKKLRAEEKEQREKHLKEIQDAEKAARKKAEDEEKSKQEKISKLGIEAASNLAKVFTSAAGAMYKGEKGLTAYGASVDAAAASMTALVGIVALMTGGVSLMAGAAAAAGAAIIAGGAAYVKAAAEQSDKLYNTFQDISRAGAAGADGLKGLYSDMQKFGLGIQDLDKLAGLLKNSSQALSNFGGTVFQGRKRFADLSKGMEQYREQLMNAGLSQDEINEATAGYLTIQSRIGTVQTRNTNELVESTRHYLIEQEALTKLTGLNRKDQESARERMMSRERFAGRLAEMRANQQNEAAEQMQQFLLLVGKHDQELADGLADLSTGMIGSNEAIKAHNALNGEGSRIMEMLATKQINAGQAADMMRTALMAQQKASNANTQAQIGIYNFWKGDFAKQQSFIAAGNEGYAKSLAEAQEQLKKQGATGELAMDEELRRQTQLRLDQQKSMMNMQDFVRGGVKPAQKALSTFGKVVEWITKMLPFSGDARREAALEGTQQARDTEAAEEKIYGEEQKLLKIRERLVSAKDKIEQDILKKELEAAEKNLDVARERLDQIKAGRAPDNTGVPAAARTQVLAEAGVHAARAGLAKAQEEALAINEKILGKITNIKDTAKQEIDTAKKNAEAAAENLKRAKESVQAAKTQEELTAAMKRREHAEARQYLARLQLFKAQEKVIVSSSKDQTEAGKEELEAAKKKIEAAETELRTANETYQKESGGKPMGAQPVQGSYLQKMIQVESGGKNIANNSGVGGTPTSSAFGIAQITKGTFEGLAKQAAPSNPLYGKTFEDMKKSPELQMVAAEQLTDENRRFLARYDLPTTDSALYLAHFLGASGARALLSSPDSVNVNQILSKDKIDANKSILENKTVGDVKKWADVKMGGTGYQVAKYAEGGDIPAGKMGIVGDAGQEIVQGPASVTSNNDIVSAFRDMISLMSQSIDRLDNIATIQRNNLDVNQKMLKVAQN